MAAPRLCLGIPEAYESRSPDQSHISLGFSVFRFLLVQCEHSSERMLLKLMVNGKIKWGHRNLNSAPEPLQVQPTKHVWALANQKMLTGKAGVDSAAGR